MLLFYGLTWRSIPLLISNNMTGLPGVKTGHFCLKPLQALVNFPAEAKQVTDSSRFLIKHLSCHKSGSNHAGSILMNNISTQTAIKLEAVKQWRPPHGCSQ